MFVGAQTRSAFKAQFQQMPERWVTLRQPTSRSAWSARSLLPLSKTKGARTRRLAATHSDTRACSLSSSGGEGRGEEKPWVTEPKIISSLFFGLALRSVGCKANPKKGGAGAQTHAAGATLARSWVICPK